MLAAIAGFLGSKPREARPPMSDYFSVISRAVRALDASTNGSNV
jgi:hypothetical protein